jgi:hypothetical protein
MRRCALLSGSRKCRIPGLYLNSKAVAGEAAHRVAFNREDDFDELSGALALCQHPPRCDTLPSHYLRAN